MALPNVKQLPELPTVNPIQDLRSKEALVFNKLYESYRQRTTTKPEPELAKPSIVTPSTIMEESTRQAGFWERLRNSANRRMNSLRRLLATVRHPDQRVALSWDAAGNSTTNAVPLPTVLSTPICPPWACTNCRVMARPSPLPPALWARALSAFQKRSKNKGQRLGGDAAAGILPHGQAHQRRRTPHCAAPTVTCPPAGVWRSALASRLLSTWSSRP